MPHVAGLGKPGGLPGPSTLPSQAEPMMYSDGSDGIWSLTRERQAISASLPHQEIATLIILFLPIDCFQFILFVFSCLVS
jgi:hypothetical protein